jgi:hypothetical protein
VKHRLTGALLLVGLLVTGASLVVVYLTRTVLDPDAFSSRFVAALERPGVSTFVAQQITDGVVAANRDLTGVKPLIATFTQAVVNSVPFRVLARRGALEAHRLIFSTGAEHIMLSVPDVGVLLRGTLQTVSPVVAQRVPANVRAVIDTRLTGAMAARVVATLRAAARLRLFARLGLVIGVLLMIGAVALAPARRQALLDASMGLLTMAAILALVVPLGRAAVMGAVADPLLRAAAGDLWTAFAGGLGTWGLALTTAGLMLMAGAAAFLERVALRDVFRRGILELAGRQPSPGREAIRVAVLLVIGGFAMFAPLNTLLAATIGAGTLVLALAVYELVALLAPGLESTATVALPRLNPALGLALICVVIAAAGMGALALALRFRPKAAAIVTGPVLECNGAVALCDRRIDKITFAGAHNAMGSSDNPRWMFPNQDAGLVELLGLGVRAFMLDVWNGHPVADRIKTDFENEEQRHKYEVAIGPEAFAAAMRIRDRLVGEGGEPGLYMCHGFCELGAVPFDSALAQFKTFLVANPSDVVLVIIEDYVAPADIAAAFNRAGLMEYVYTGSSRGPFPTLRELIESNQRLIVMAEHHTGELPWYHQAFEMMQETPYTFHTPEEFSCKPNRGDASSPLLLINQWIETTPAPRPSNAKLVNTETALLARAQECQRVRGKAPNVIAVDFAATGDVVRAAAVLNGLEKPQLSTSSR